MLKRAAGLLLSLVVTLLIVTTPNVQAQNSDIEALSGLQFNFSNPGARALGMGGAFLALADDASAAETNPAGLTVLSRPEVALEARYFDAAQRFNARGAFPEIETEDVSSDAISPTFASFVTPIGSAVVAAYYHEPLRYDTDVDRLALEQATFSYGPGIGLVNRGICDQIGSPACETYLLPGLATSVSVHLRTFGVAGAWKSGNTSFGAAVRYQTFSEEAVTTLDTPFISTQTSDGDDITYSFGVKLDATPKLAFGVVYKSGARFPAAVTADDIGAGSIEFPTDFHLPDLLGVGVSFRPTASMVFALDVVNVEYSNLTDNFVTTFGGTVDASQFQIEDGMEVRAGGEYVIPLRIPLALRAGYWRDPAHGIEFRGPIDSLSAAVALLTYPRQEAQSHVTVGLGLAWNRIELNAAYDHAERLKVGSVSIVSRF